MTDSPSTERRGFGMHANGQAASAALSIRSPRTRIRLPTRFDASRLLEVSH